MISARKGSSHSVEVKKGRWSARGGDFGWLPIPLLWYYVTIDTVLQSPCFFSDTLIHSFHERLYVTQNLFSRKWW